VFATGAGGLIREQAAASQLRHVLCELAVSLLILRPPGGTEIQDSSPGGYVHTTQYGTDELIFLKRLELGSSQHESLRVVSWTQSLSQSFAS
jgi:hypothetical protein